jgi:hypothetical protein
MAFCSAPDEGQTFADQQERIVPLYTEPHGLLAEYFDVVFHLVLEEHHVAESTFSGTLGKRIWTYRN